MIDITYMMIILCMILYIYDDDGTIIDIVYKMMVL